MARVTVELADLAPFVAELVAWLGPDACSPELVGLIRAAARDVLALEREGLAEILVLGVDVRWCLDTIVEHALLPLGALSLVDGQPVIPDLAAVLGRVRTDPRLGPVPREALLRVLAENVVMEDQLVRESRGCE